jgi:hypothetical protein
MVVNSRLVNCDRNKKSASWAFLSNIWISLFENRDNHWCISMVLQVFQSSSCHCSHYISPHLRSSNYMKITVYSFLSTDSHRILTVMTEDCDQFGENPSGFQAFHLAKSNNETLLGLFHWLSGISSRSSSSDWHNNDKLHTRFQKTFGTWGYAGMIMR